MRPGPSAPSLAPGPAFRRPANNLIVIYGFHAVCEALRGRRRKVLDLYATDAAARRLEGEIADAGLCPHRVTADDLARRLGASAVHQGIMLEAQPLDPLDLSDIVSQSGIVLVLDQITDPHNVGAIFRSAAAIAATAIVTTQRHSPDATGALAKAASGALEFVPLVSVQNLARGLAALKQSGVLVVGLDSSGEADLAALPLRAPLALVFGAEGKGLRQLTKETCDAVARIELPGTIKSLNVSNAAALALYVASRRLSVTP